MRAITESTTCPALAVDGDPRPMQVRAATDGGNFPVTVCEAPLRNGTRSATVAGQALPLPDLVPHRILLIGDTGCRMEAPDDFQACNDPAAWPFAKVAARAAAWRPDLVIHLGDYHYRESACPSGNVGCAGNPAGDTWASWRADFFTPAAPLLRAAPWIFIRGNHEACARAGEGWFRFLEPRARPATCTDETEPYVVPLGEAVVGVIDSSAASDTKADPGDVARYAGQLDRLASMRPPYRWLVTHRPVWSAVNIGQPTLATGNKTLQAAIRGRLPDSVTLLLAGHVHLFEALAFGDRRPPMMIVGNSGTELDAEITQPVAGLPIDGVTVTSATIIRAFGYTTIESSAGAWRATIHDVDGRVVTECTLRGRAMTCVP